MSAERETISARCCGITAKRWRFVGQEWSTERQSHCYRCDKELIYQTKVGAEKKRGGLKYLRGDFSRAVFAAVQAAPEPFTPSAIFATLPADHKLCSRNRVTQLLDSWAQWQHLIKTKMGMRGPNGHEAEYQRGKTFTAPRPENLPAAEPIVKLSPLEQQWREFRATMDIQVPDLQTSATRGSENEAENE